MSEHPDEGPLPAEPTLETEPEVPTGMQGLDPSARLLFHLQALVRLITVQLPMSALVGVGITALTSSLLYGFATSAILAFAFFLLALWYPSLSFDRWGYELREEELLIQRGVLFRSLTAIPTARVQHVDTRQGPMEQWFGLARVQIYTAAGMGADGVIPGLDLDDAEALRDELVRRHGDDGV